MVWASPFPGKYKVWRGLSFGLSFLLHHGLSFVPRSQKPWGRARFMGVELCTTYFFIQGGSGTEPEPETRTIGTVFPETESGTGTAGTIFQEPKPEPEPSFPVKVYWNTEKPFMQRNRRNRKPEPIEPFHPKP